MSARTLISLARAILDTPPRERSAQFTNILCDGLIRHWDNPEACDRFEHTRSVVASRLRDIVGPMWSQAYCDEVAGKLLGEG